ncbi:MAG: class I SAM-dependent methyltransferase [Saprospiraceae bacterium]|nr:class I SAM-dependent methyltransferase [Saprospiraceae bacterium]
MNYKEIQYSHDRIVHNLKASSIICEYINTIFSPKSVIDVGCGLGTWLKAFQNLGIEDIIGLDGKNVKKDELYIDEKYFIETDLRFKLEINRKFDLVLCLEVAEHLSVEFEDSLLNQLKSLQEFNNFFQQQYLVKEGKII